MNKTILKNMIAEWLEEFALPTFIPRDAAPVPADLRNLSEILAIVGPRRAGKTFVMYQMIASLMERHILDGTDILHGGQRRSAQDFRYIPENRRLPGSSEKINRDRNLFISTLREKWEQPPIVLSLDNGPIIRYQ
jgi:hypothetical protein